MKKSVENVYIMFGEQKGSSWGGKGGRYEGR
jgi:hypothetical protein